MSDTKLECLMLSEPDLIEAGVLNMKQCVRTMEEVFHLYSQGDFLTAALLIIARMFGWWYSKIPLSARKPKEGVSYDIGSPVK